MANNDRVNRRSGLAELFGELSEEIDGDAFTELTPEQRQLEAVAREILKLEKDMTIPGSAQPDGVRLERLMQFIEERDF